jgi:Tfp pilus assembly protein PilP
MMALALVLAFTTQAASQPSSQPPKPAPAPAKPATAPQVAAPPVAAPPPAPAAATPQPTPAPAPVPQPPVETYTYRAEGRRDPFQSLVGASSNIPGGRRGEGPAGMTFNEISISGVMQSRGSLVAMIKGPDNKTYLVHPGDKLLDGTIKTITPTGIVVVQEVNDPLSLVKQREVRKLLRSLEDAKE